MKDDREKMLAGVRVVVKADKTEGTDHEFNGRVGTVVEFGQFIAVRFDKPPKYWSNPALICPHNLRAEALALPAPGGKK